MLSAPGRSVANEGHIQNHFHVVHTSANGFFLMFAAASSFIFLMLLVAVAY